MQTRLQSAFHRLTFNEAGMMTRRQKAMFDKMYGNSARKVQEIKSQVSSSFPLPIDVRGKWADWVSPSSFWDYFQEDEFMYVVNSSSSSSSKEEEKKPRERKHPPHRQKIFDEGNMFEEKVVEFYQNRFEKEEIVQVAPGKDSNEARNGKLRKKTIQEMMKGTPIILQGVLWNEELKCYGVADMIVRNDYLPRMVEDFRPDDYFEAKAPNLKGDYHYRVIDIKNKILNLSTKSNKDGELNDALTYRHPKAQLWFYNYEVSRIQGYNPQVTYILGNKVIIGSGKYKEVFPHFNHRFGEVDYRVGKNQKYENEVRRCIQWIKEAKQYTMKKLLQMSVPLPCPELYPNMCRKFHEDKLKFAQHIGELTMLYNCGTEKKNKAFLQNIFSYHDEKCSPSIFYGEQTKCHRIISSELKLIRQGGDISPTKEEGLENSFFREHGEQIAAFDVEFFDEPDYSALPSVQRKVIVYMIGFAMRHMPTGLTRVMNFTAKEMTEQGEKEMVFRFIHFLNSIPVGIELFHWNNTEKTVWKRWMNKYPNLRSFMQKKFVKDRVEVGSRDTIIFSDMLEEFHAEPIVLNDTYGFGLKKVVNKMIELGIVKSDAWRNLNCLNGADSIVLIKQAKEMCEKMGTPLDEHPLTKEIDKYNAADCVVLLDLYEGVKNYYH